MFVEIGREIENVFIPYETIFFTKNRFTKYIMRVIIQISLDILYIIKWKEIRVSQKRNFWPRDKSPWTIANSRTQIQKREKVLFALRFSICRIKRRDIPARDFSIERASAFNADLLRSWRQKSPVNTIA